MKNKYTLNWKTRNCPLDLQRCYLFKITSASLAQGRLAVPTCNCMVIKNNFTKG